MAAPPSGEEADLELLLLPLAHDGPARVRALGVLAPTAPPYWLGEKPAAELALTTLRHLGSTPGKPGLAQSGAGRRGQPDSGAVLWSIAAAGPANAALTIAA